MSSPIDRPLILELRLPSSHPELLEGLDIWLRLGLISDAQVRQISRNYLVCSVRLQPQVENQPQEVLTNATRSKPLIASLPPEPKVPAKPNFMTSMFQSLGEELSVRWLLFLGVFLVVLSSGVLAASQWEKFPAVGQYGVLLAYTLSFGGFTFWAGKQTNLTLTAQTLLVVTLLLVPVNFWAMDSFSLWNNPLNWVVLAIAFLLLSTITVLLSRTRTIINNFPNGKLPLFNLLGLSYLHLGWKISGFPLIAVYLAMVGTTLITVYQNLRQPRENSDEQTDSWGIGIYFAVIIYELLGLLSRAIFVANVNVTQLGLAIGICGWLAVWLAERNLYFNPSLQTEREINTSTNLPSLTSIWKKLGIIFLFLGWLVSVVDQPWQAIAVSGLGLWVFIIRLQKYNFQIDLFTFFSIGLQAHWLVWQLVPEQLQNWIINTANNLTNHPDETWTLLSLALFPYLVLMVALTNSFHRANKPNLVMFGDQLNVLFGVSLTMLGIINPTVRSLNLLFSTITLATITKQRFSIILVYLTHVTGVLTICSSINWWFPNLSSEIWAVLLLVLMVGEWIFSGRETVWKDSAWYIGLGLAAVSFFLLWIKAEEFWYGNVNYADYWRTIWLITPVTLTVLGSRSSEDIQKTKIYVSIISVLSAQLLTLPLAGTRLIGLGVGTAVMFVNTRYLKNQTTAGTTIGFGLILIAATLWQIFPNISLSGWLLINALAVLGLWVGRKLLFNKTRIYALAADKWAIALCILELFSITIHSFLIYATDANPGIFYLTATLITLAAIIYRSWQQPNNWAFYSIGWCLELLVAEVLGFWQPSMISITIANIALGLTTQLFGEWWQRKYQTLPTSFNILPLIYGVFSVILRINTFSDWTGLCSLGVALIMISIGRRKAEFKPLLYFGIIGISISAYELLFYQMSIAKGGTIGDGLIAMSALGTSIMYAYRILSPWLVSYLRLTPGEIKNLANLHWLWSSSLFLGAITLPIQNNLYVGIGTGVFLTRYAIWQGRRNNLHAAVQTFGNIAVDEIWVYLGLIELGITTLYLQDLSIGRFFTQQLMPWNGALACLLSYFLYILPWENLGWSKTPWQRTAYILPLIILWLTQQQIYPITLIIAAGYYAFLSTTNRQLRFTYISVILIDWALFNWFEQLNLKDTLWYITPIGLSILYIAQIDPQLKLPESKEIRHFVRIIGSGLICGWAVLLHQDSPYIPGIFSLIAIFAGLALRVRAFLYIGTAAFLSTSIYQLVIFSLRYSFLKWIVGLLVGILLIYIAANFETRRTQINSLLRSSNDKFQEWE
ncbi:DUF2157 domain-containing protein [Sphaerospermopsis aphanizomenoides BCCUSP55]|uniref:DUF2157 domain-containing protein n=1 Tax=Sphaerospermopsis aphanizomenoides TaxID=459663 RepID=UPI00190562DB|nr:DUF2157 domain-containing protein [Sphaerospermopsis aphanizomenoides]MBK1989125.1 DUF2157 domain-containing protein [Sphaerospermopsis aphanizomenoides BCCUSP55]